MPDEKAYQLLGMRQSRHISKHRNPALIFSYLGYFPLEIGLPYTSGVYLLSRVRGWIRRVE
jgi:hypothetical protein